MTPTRGKPIVDGLRTAATSAVGSSGSVIRRLGFWTAILLPVLYVPLMLINHPLVVDLANVSKVIALHVASLFVGRGHAARVDDE